MAALTWDMGLMDMGLRVWREKILLILHLRSLDEEALAARKKFSSSEGDHIAYLKIFRAFKSAQNKKEWCMQNFVNFRQMTFAFEVRKQLMELCRKEDIPVQSAGNQTEPVRRALAQGLFTNVARLTREGTYVTVIYYTWFFLQGMYEKFDKLYPFLFPRF